MEELRVNLTNTPGIYYVIAYFLSSCLYIRMNPRRYNGVKLWGIQLLYLMVLGCFMVFTDNIDKAYFWPCMAVEFCLQWAVIYLCCRTEKSVIFYDKSFYPWRVCSFTGMADVLFWTDQYAVGIEYGLESAFPYSFPWSGV